MTTELTTQQREDRKKAMQEVTENVRTGDEYQKIAIDATERAIRTERERDEAVRLIEWIRSMEIVEQMGRIDAFLAHKGESNG